MQYLSLQEVAELEGKTYSGVKKSVVRGKLNAERINVIGKRGCGFEYRVPITELSEKARIRYAAQHSTNFEVTPIPSATNEIDVKFDELSLDVRTEALKLEKIIKEWRLYLADHPEKSATADYVKQLKKEGKNISERTLYRKWERYKEVGIVGLADLRGHRKRTGQKIDEYVWNTFQNWWLDENQPSVSFLYTLLEQWLKENKPEKLPLPSESTFRRAVEMIPAPVVKYFRYGAKAFTDECRTFVHRSYGNLFSNEVWSSDYHTLDIMVRDDKTGEVYRPHFVSWIDIKSRKVLGFRLMRSASSDGVILCFRDSVLEYGLPQTAYLDNGREFLSSAFGGRGRRKTDENADYGSTILERCGVTMVNANVGNAKAKIIERFHKTMTNQFAKMFLTYVGKGPSFRPHRHNEVLKYEKNIPLLSEIQRDLENYLYGMYNNAISQAEGMQGMSPNDCYQKNLIEKRTATEEQLRLMMTRSTKLQQYKRDGVYLTVAGEKVYFYDSEYVQKLLGQKVYIRYDSDNLSKVYLYDEKERYIGECQKSKIGGYAGADDVEAIKEVATHNKKIRRDVKTYLTIRDLKDTPEVVEAMRSVTESMEQKDMHEYDAKVIRPVMTQPLAKVAGDDEAKISFETMIENAKKRREKK